MRVPNINDSTLKNMLVEWASQYIVTVCGKPPSGFRLHVNWRPLSPIPELKLRGDRQCPRTLEAYIYRCKIAFDIFLSAIDWQKLNPWAVSELLEDLGSSRRTE